MTRVNTSATLRLRVDAVKAAMVEHGVTSQEQLAEDVGVGRATVVRAFSGRHAPGDALIAGIRLRLGLPLDQIVEVVTTKQLKRRTAPQVRSAA